MPRPVSGNAKTEKAYVRLRKDEKEKLDTYSKVNKVSRDSVIRKLLEEKNII